MNLFIDTETTGLPRGGVQPRIVSIAWIVADALTQHRSLKSMIVKPHGFLIPDKATEIHGITTARARREGIALDAALGQLAHDINTYKPERVVAHNLGFDRPIVEAEYRLLGLACALAGLDGACTVELSRDRWPRQPAKLGDVYRRLFGVPLEGAHDARNDVSACMRIFFALQGIPPTGANDHEEARHAGVLIERVLDWAADGDWFDTSFVENLKESLEKWGRLTPRQLEALENIIDRFDIP
jgi:DNA polymerase III epsilon subunit-like protein